MSASDHLNPQQFFHGSDHVFGTGDTIDPSRALPYVQQSHGDAYAFATTDRDTASRFGRHVYPVAPQGTMETDPQMPLNAYRTKQPLTVLHGEDALKTTIQGILKPK
jgi:hypothetical protein